jgi:hypothetical protein
VYEFGDFFWSANPCASPLPQPAILIFFQLFFFRIHHPVNRDDRHLLAHAMTSDFSKSHGSSSQKGQLVFHYRSNSMPEFGDWYFSQFSENSSSTYLHSTTTFFTEKKLGIYFLKNGFGNSFWAIFDKLIWSPVSFYN